MISTRNLLSTIDYPGYTSGTAAATQEVFGDNAQGQVIFTLDRNHRS